MTEPAKTDVLLAYPASSTGDIVFPYPIVDGRRNKPPEFSNFYSRDLAATDHALQYGYLDQIRSSRRLEAECRRNVELMWLLGRLCPDHKSIAEFRRIHRDAVTAAGVELFRFAKAYGLIRGEWIAIDGTKFRAVSSIDTARERFNLQKYLDGMEKADEEQPTIDSSAMQTALEKLKQHPEPEVGFMLMGRNTLPAYNMQAAVDAEHSLIVASTVVPRPRR